ncbi:MAG: aldo/keto reductase [Streptococcus salivarius]
MPLRLLASLEDIFLTSKAWISQLVTKIPNGLKRTLRKLDTDYLDLYLIHQPFGDLHGAWRAMIELSMKNLLEPLVFLTSQQGV